MELATIRPIGADDAESVAALCTSLGYPASAEDINPRIEALTDSADRIALAAVLLGRVVGWIDAAVERHIQSAPVVVIGGLVVREDMRGKRIGQQLCQVVERWAIENRMSKVRVRSQQKRADAHRFYLRDGYKQVKISAVFEKQLLL